MGRVTSVAKVCDLLNDRFEQPIRETGLSKLDARPSEHIPEIGTGHCLVELARTVVPEDRVMGIDISEEMTRLARELLRKEHP